MLPDLSGSTVVLAVNPVSGGGRGFLAGALAAVTLRAAGLTVLEVSGDDEPQLRTRVAAALAEHAPDALVVVGGDGMAHLGANAVAGTRTPLGIVAAGSGNDIARELGLPVLDAESAARSVVLHFKSPRPVDAAKVTTAAGETRWFLGVLAAGLDAVINERANGWRWPRGRARYVLATLRELPLFRPRHYRLTLDQTSLQNRFVLVTVANCASYGGGMRVCPEASPDDGQLDVLTVDPLSRLRLLRLFPRLFAGTHVREPAVHIQRASKIRIDAPGLVAYADGERVGPLPVECEVVVGAIWVLAPEHRQVA